jgi:cytochrome c oxidase subunit 2
MRSRVALLGGTAALSACASRPLDYLEGFSPGSRPLVALAWGFSLISVVVCLVIAALLVGGLMRRRETVEGEALAVRRDGGGMRWIYIGLGVSVPVLLAMTVWSVASIGAVAAPPRKPQLTVEVTGAQWFWDVTYADPKIPAGRFNGANEIVIPTHVPVRLVLRSRDVIHSFWVPKLAGKMDMIPGQTNIHWMEADRPGVYRGQCAEFCGLQHAKMAFTVTAVPLETWQRWRRLQLAGIFAPAQSAPAAAGGQVVFAQRCAACHAVRGSEAGGTVGPDLSNFGARPTIAAGTLPNTRANLAYWIGHTQEVKPGARMPAVNLRPDEQAAVVAYLESL